MAGKRTRLVGSRSGLPVFLGIKIGAAARGTFETGRTANRPDACKRAARNLGQLFRSEFWSRVAHELLPFVFYLFSVYIWYQPRAGLHGSQSKTDAKCTQATLRPVTVDSASFPLGFGGFNALFDIREWA